MGGFGRVPFFRILFLTCDILKSGLWPVMGGLSVPDASDVVVKRKQEPIYPQGDPNKA